MKYKVVLVEGGSVEVENVATCNNTEEVFYMMGENGKFIFLAPLNHVLFITKIES